MSTMVTCAVVWVSDADTAAAVGDQLRSSLVRMGFAESEFEVLTGPATGAEGEALPAGAAPGGRVVGFQKRDI